jgi:hypothetical protein
VKRVGLLVGVALAALGAPLGWAISDRLERDDAFCTSCHLAEGRPLHEAKLADFRARPAATLVAAHGATGNDAHDDRRFRCIDCHGGVGALGRTRVKLLSMRDALWYAAGRFEEPERMTWPLRDEDCSQCHAAFDERVPADGENPRFHQLPVHNRELGVACVECHLAHPDAGLADHFFLHARTVRGQCASCHLEFAESQEGGS